MCCGFQTTFLFGELIDGHKFILTRTYSTIIQHLFSAHSPWVALLFIQCKLPADMVFVFPPFGIPEKMRPVVVDDWGIPFSMCFAL